MVGIHDVYVYVYIFYMSLLDSNEDTHSPFRLFAKPTDR